MADEKARGSGSPSPLAGRVASASEPGGDRSPVDPTRNAAHCDLPASEEAGASARKLTPEAQRALAEAEERRKAAAEAARPQELGGRDGPEPVRYGDWENKGIAVDF